MCVHTQVFYKELACVHGAWQAQICSVCQQVQCPGKTGVQIEIQRQPAGEFSLAQAGWPLFYSVSTDNGEQFAYSEFMDLNVNLIQNHPPVDA